MDFPIKHWGAFPRRHPSLYPVFNTNFINAKDHWVRTTFSTCNFSFILRGRGEFHRLGKVWPVVAPCVITQWPGEALEYGPAPFPSETWDELYITYPAEAKPRFESARLIDPGRPLWPIRDVEAIRALVNTLRDLINTAEPAAVADRIDRVCERMILESWLPPARREAPVGDAATVHTILAEIQARLSDPALRPESLAARHGWSVSTFRRRWAEVMPESPARTLQALRMQAACRCLVESSLPVREIATRTGFADEFYFSRRFRLELGCAPREYRRTYLLNRS
ncbi:MAG: hypothetical protein RL376_1058 [Verrucomicrobiota bacterium]|jgi:AraC-like DNA-binding protein